MKGITLVLCLLLMKLNPGDGQFTCPTDDSSSFNSWLCELSDWMESMKEWKQRIERDCSVEDIGTEWEDMFCCSDPITVTCCDETMQHCDVNEFNCTICYCMDGKYANRQQYKQLWRKYQADFRKAMRLYDEKLRFCVRRPKCDLNNAVTAVPVTETDSTAEDDHLTATAIPTTETGSTTEVEKRRTTAVPTTETDSATENDQLTTTVFPMTDTDSTTEDDQLTTTTDFEKVTSKPMISTAEVTAKQTTKKTETTIGMKETDLPEQSTAQLARNSSCPVAYEGKCFIILDDEYLAGLNTDDQVCMNSGGNLANIYSLTHLDELLKYIEEYVRGSYTLLYIRLGLTIDLETNTLYLRDGVTKAPTGLNRHGSVAPGYTAMFMSVSLDEEVLSYSIFNFLPALLAPVICEAE